MNFKQLLETQDESKMRQGRIPFGYFYKKSVEGKYINVVDFTANYTCNIRFEDAVEKECEAKQDLKNRHLMSFLPVYDPKGIIGLQAEAGSFVSFEQLLADNPAVVAKKNFIENTVNDLLDVAEFLHENEIYHICFAPSNVFARKGEYSVVLIQNGSFYLNLSDQAGIYMGVEDYVAPEVLAEDPEVVIDERSDVYSIGKFIGFLLGESETPFEYKKVLEKATAENPSDRYQTIGEMRSAIKGRRNMLRSLITGAAAVVVALVLLGLYLSLAPEPTEMEYVKPAPKEYTSDDPLDDGFDPDYELGYVRNDTTGGQLSADPKMRDKEYQAKAEEIFRKQYEREADRILSKIYNQEFMGASEKKFMAASQSVMDELVRKQVEMSKQMNIDNAKGQRIASEIIDRVTERKKANLQYNGIQK